MLTEKCSCLRDIKFIEYLFNYSIFLQHVLPKLRDGKDFIMVGYSFGSIIAIELTRRLEAMNFKGRVILIDGAPEQMRMMYKEFISDCDDVDLQIFVLFTIMETYSTGSGEKVIFYLI